MHTIRKTNGTLTRIICLLFALHIFNLSIDPKDPEPAFMPEDISVNDIESLSEFFAEVVLGLNDSFAEHDEADDGGSIALDICKVFFARSDDWHLIVANSRATPVHYFSYNTDSLPLLAREIDSPPPRA
jgi:hypothetical protein